MAMAPGVGMAAMAPSSADAGMGAPASGPAEASAAAPSAPVPVQTTAPQGCALSFVGGNSSYSKFQQILNAAPSTSNFSSEPTALQ